MDKQRPAHRAPIPPEATPEALSLPAWFRTGENAYFCGLIAVELRQRSDTLRAAGRVGAALEADCIAAIIEGGDFHWLH